MPIIEQHETLLVFCTYKSPTPEQLYKPVGAMCAASDNEGQAMSDEDILLFLKGMENFVAFRAFNIIDGTVRDINEQVCQLLSDNDLAEFEPIVEFNIDLPEPLYTIEDYADNRCDLIREGAL